MDLILLKGKKLPHHSGCLMTCYLLLNTGSELPVSGILIPIPLLVVDTTLTRVLDITLMMVLDVTIIRVLDITLMMILDVTIMRVLLYYSHEDS